VSVGPGELASVAATAALVAVMTAMILSEKGLALSAADWCYALAPGFALRPWPSTTPSTRLRDSRTRRSNSGRGGDSLGPIRRGRACAVFSIDAIAVATSQG